jgi:hypothetical protein
LKISEVTEIYHHRQPLYYDRVHPETISQSQQARQTERAATAVRNALVRRGLSDRYCFNVTSDNRFKIEANINRRSGKNLHLYYLTPPIACYSDLPIAINFYT